MSPHSLRTTATAALVLVLALTAGPPALAADGGEPLPASPDALRSAPVTVVPAGEEAWEPSATTPLPAARAASARSERHVDALESGTSTISGTVRVSEADGSVADQLPSDASLSVEPWTADGTSLGLWPVQQDLTFSVGGLDAGTPYYLLVRDTSSRYASIWYGGSAVAAGAQAVRAPAAGVELSTSRTGSLSGTFGGFSGDRVIDIWYREPSNGSYYQMDSQQIRVSFGDPYTFSSVAAGDYLVRASSQYGVVDDSYWDHVLRSGDATEVAVAVGRATTGIDLSLDDEYLQYTGRFAGSDRYGTSVESTRAVFEPGIPVLYLASGANWPDALSAGPAAAAQGGALLLTDPDRLPPVVAAEIDRLAPDRVVVAGSDRSVSDAVLAAVRAIVPDTRRIGGVDRYDTSRLLVADAFGAGPYSTVFLATGTNFPDALSAAPIAGWRGLPVVLVDGATTSVDTATARSLDELEAEHVEFIGGTPSITRAYEDDVTRRGFADSVSRIAGGDRYDTSVQLNRAYPQSLLQDSVFLAAGASFADALSGAASAAAIGSSVLLVERDCVHDGTLDFMQHSSKNYAFLLGGEPTLTADVANLRNCEYGG